MSKRKYTQEEMDNIAIVKHSNKICCYCGKELSWGERTIEHILPINRGGETIPENLAVCCEACNKEKSDMTLQEYIEYKDKKKDFVGDIELKIRQEKDTENYYSNLLLDVTQNKELINYLKHIIEVYDKKVTMLTKLKEVSQFKIDSLIEEKALMNNLFDLEITREKVGKLNNGDIELDFNYRLKLDKENLLKDPIIKSMVINSTVNNSTINCSFINNSRIVNSNIINSKID